MMSEYMGQQLLLTMAALAYTPASSPSSSTLAYFFLEPLWGTLPLRGNHAETVFSPLTFLHWGKKWKGMFREKEELIFLTCEKNA